ncbi:MAG: acyl carrier protein [Isosphaeraceae bacterium]
MSSTASHELVAQIAEILHGFPGLEYGGPIDADTRFFADLGLASIDAVVLGEALEVHFGRKLPFSDLMGDLGRRTDRDLRIGELAQFLESHLN